jgi:hypothetical protein
MDLSLFLHLGYFRSSLQSRVVGSLKSSSFWFLSKFCWCKMLLNHCI